MAEYGVPDMMFSIEGKVLSMDSNPIEGVTVSSNSSSTETDSLGNYSLDVFNTSKNNTISFIDTDQSENGLFAQKDTTLTLDEENITELNVILEEVEND